MSYFYTCLFLPLLSFFILDMIDLTLSSPGMSQVIRGMTYLDSINRRQTSAILPLLREVTVSTPSFQSSPSLRESNDLVVPPTQEYFAHAFYGCRRHNRRVVFDETYPWRAYPTTIAIYLAHERIIGNFRTIVFRYLDSMSLFLQSGDFTDQSTERTRGFLSSKTPDWAFGPYDARVDLTANKYLFLVLKVSASKSSNELRRDANWWYANTRQETKLVALIDVNDNPYCFDFEVWKPVPWPFNPKSSSESSSMYPESVVAERDGDRCPVIPNFY